MIRLLILSFILVFSACNFGNNEPENYRPNTNFSRPEIRNDEIKLVARFNSFDTTVEVLFTDTHDSIDYIQMKNFDNFISKQEVLTPEILQKIFDFYKSSYDDYKSGWKMNRQISDLELEKYLPTPTTPLNLKPFITPVIIHIPNKSDCRDGIIGIEFYCTWDIENGLGVLIKDWTVLEASVAEISYF